MSVSNVSMNVNQRASEDIFSQGLESLGERRHHVMLFSLLRLPGSYAVQIVDRNAGAVDRVT